MSEKSLAHQALTSTFAMPDERSFGVFKMLNDVYPAFAKKILDGNVLMTSLVMSGYNPMDILDYPICGKCETLAPYNGYGIKDGKVVQRCTCVADKCGASTLNPVTLRQWIKYEMKKKVSEDFYEAIELAIDEIAYTMLMKQMMEVNHYMKLHNKKEQTVNNVEPEITHYGGLKPELPLDAIEIKEELEGE